MKIVKEYSSGGVIFREVNNENKEVLLIRVRKNGFELPKGHIEQGESESQAAIRECCEEVGIINDLALGDKVGEISYTFSSKNKTIQKKVSYYAITFSEEFNYVKPKNTREIIWVSERELEAIELVNEELRPIIAKCLL